MKPCGAHGPNIASHGCAACLEVDARLKRIEGALRAARMHPPECGYRGDWVEADFGGGIFGRQYLVMSPCTCGLNDDGKEQGA